jgi:hypothetical protein
MADVTFEEVLHLAKQLKSEEQAALAEHLQELTRTRQLSAEEKCTLFESIVVDIGPWPQDWSLRREDGMTTSGKAFVDTNVLICATIATAPFHKEAEQA